MAPFILSLILTAMLAVNVQAQQAPIPQTVAEVRAPRLHTQPGWRWSKGYGGASYLSRSSRRSLSRDEKVILAACWNILGDHGDNMLVIESSRFRIPIASDGYEGMTSAESRAVEALSREIALAIKSLR